MRRTRAVVTAVAGAMALALFVSACGSSGGGTVTVTAAPAPVPAGGGGATTSPPSVVASAPVSVKVSPSAPVSVASPQSGGSGPTGGGGSGGGNAPSSNTYAGTDQQIAEFGQDLTASIQITNGFWTNHWSQYFTGTYQPPSVFGQYKGLYFSREPVSATYPQPSCAGSPALENNAFYCNPEDYLAWDYEFLDDAYDLGDTFVYYIIAHEWGHAIQNRLNGALVTVAKELQADCLAGATLYGSVADGTLLLETGDEAEIANSLTDIADDTPWSTTGDHGSPLQRIQWFTAGKDGGVQACLAMPQSEGATG